MIGVTLVFLSLLRVSVAVKCYYFDDFCSQFSRNDCTGHSCYMRVAARVNPSNETQFQYSLVYGCLPEYESTINNNGSSSSGLFGTLCNGPASWSGDIVISYSCCSSDYCNKNIAASRHDIEGILMPGPQASTTEVVMNSFASTSNEQFISPTASLPLSREHSQSLFSEVHVSTTSSLIHLAATTASVTYHDSKQKSSNDLIIWTILVVVLLVVILVIFSTFLILRICSKKNEEFKTNQKLERGQQSRDKKFQDTISSGSGFGSRELITRTMANDIVLGEHIGKGAFGSICRCTYRGNTFAIKRILTLDEFSFQREIDTYSFNLRHNNILGCITALMTSVAEVTECWIVLQYCPQGSLFDALSASPPSVETGVKLVYSACMGLVYLHTSLCGYNGGILGKPAIAHRDIKSKNILLKDHETCCIADFGLSIAEGEDYESFVNLYKGTKRYMSPDLLNGTINVKDFKMFLLSDVYSFGLVMWEVFNRCMIEGEMTVRNYPTITVIDPLSSEKCFVGQCLEDDVKEYCIPFHDKLPSSPSFEEVKRLVVDEKVRPEIPNTWYQDKFLKEIAKFVVYCWSEKAMERQSMEYIRKKIFKEAKDAQIPLKE